MNRIPILLGYAHNPRALAFLANFGLGKGIAFLGPIGMGALLDPAIYGALEFGLAVSLFAAMILTGGIPYSTMQLILMRQGRSLNDLLALVTLMACGTGLFLVSVFSIAGAPARWLAAASLVGIASAQLSGVAFARAYGLRNLNVWIDHAPTIAAAVLTVLLMTISSTRNTSIMVAWFSALTLIVIAAATIIFTRSRQKDIAFRLREAAGVGLPMVGASLVSGWVISSGRVYLGVSNDASDIYAYAFTFRVASVLMLLHAVVGTAFAARLYKMPTRLFDRVGAAMISVLAGASVLFIFATPSYHLALWTSPEKAALLAQRPFAVLAVAQVFFWGAGAIIEMRVSRARLAFSSLSAMLALSLGVAACLSTAWITGWLSFSVVMIFLAIQQMGAVFIQHALLVRRGIPHRRMGIATLAGGAFVIAAAALAIARVS